MSAKRYTEEFKAEAVAQVKNRGYSVLVNHYFYKSSVSWYASYEFGGP